MGYSIDSLSANCYPGTSVLINKFHIREEDKLAEIENIVFAAKSVQWLRHPGSTSFDFSHYKAIHAFLFSDLYDWAGTVRTVNLSKKVTRFCDVSEVEQQAQLIFSRLKDEDFFRGLPRSAYIDELVDFYQLTNLLHPFREGNGRTQRIFIQQLLQLSGYNINWAHMDTDLLMIATIQAAQGVTDLLREIFENQIFGFSP